MDGLRISRPRLRFLSQGTTRCLFWKFVFIMGLSYRRTTTLKDARGKLYQTVETISPTEKPSHCAAKNERPTISPSHTRGTRGRETEKQKQDGLYGRLADSSIALPSCMNRSDQYGLGQVIPFFPAARPRKKPLEEAKQCVLPSARTRCGGFFIFSHNNNSISVRR